MVRQANGMGGGMLIFLTRVRGIVWEPYTNFSVCSVSQQSSSAELDGFIWFVVCFCNRGGAQQEVALILLLCILTWMPNPSKDLEVTVQLTHMRSIASSQLATARLSGSSGITQTSGSQPWDLSGIHPALFLSKNLGPSRVETKENNKHPTRERQSVILFIITPHKV